MSSAQWLSSHTFIWTHDKKVPAGKVTDNTVLILSAIYLLLWEMRLQKTNAAHTKKIHTVFFSVATPTVKPGI